MTTETLWAILTGGREGFHELRYDDESRWILTRDRRRFIRLLESPTLAKRWVSVCPRIDMKPFSPVADVSALWCRTVSGASSAALTAFEPHPTVILRDKGTVKRTALWALDRPTTELASVLRFNKRLAHRFGAPKKHGDPLFFMEPPGPKVEVEAFDPEALYDPMEVAGELNDAPAPYEGWKEERAA